MNRREIRSSLLSRILLVVVTSVALTAFGTFLFANYAARNAFGSYVRRSTGMRRQYIVASLEEYYSATGSFAGVQGLLDSAMSMGPSRGTGMGIGMGGRFGQNMRMGEMDSITLVDPSGVVIAGSGGAKPGSRANFEQWESTPVMHNGSTVALVLMGTPEEREASTRLYTGFIRQMTFGIMSSTALAAAIAMALSYRIAERTVRPVRDLTLAVSKVAQGDLSTRVQVSGGDELSRLGDAFNQMSGQLETLERQRRELVADVAHELRTPLTVLRSNFEGIKDGVIGVTPELVSTLNNEVDRLGSLVADLHVLALADAGKLELNLGTVSLESLLSQVHDAFIAPAAQKAVSLQVEASPGLCVTADFSRLLQVVYNLVDNALRHTTGGGTVAVRATRSPDGLKPEARIVVSDSGEGIPAGDLPHVFERFYRGDKSRSRKTGGSGLGLAIAKDIVAAHGGRIEVSSEVSTGTTFTIVLNAL